MKRTDAHAGLWGAALLAALAALRCVASATPTAVFLAGREVAWGCLFKRAFGLPCPVCGMTRSVILTLDGRVGAALSLNPAGPPLVAGLVLLAAALVFLHVYRRTHDARSAGLLRARLHTGVRAYSGLLFAVLFVHWVAELLAR